MGDDKAPYTPRRGGRVMLFLIVAALILLVAVCTYTCGFGAPGVTRETVIPPVTAPLHPSSPRQQSDR
jgi:hypothetical protein